MSTPLQKKYILIHERLNHTKEAIPKEYFFRCKACEFEHNIENVLQRHVKSLHDKEVRFMCSLCPIISFFKRPILMHVESHPTYTDARLLIIGCLQCKALNSHNICDQLWEKKEDGESQLTADIDGQNKDLEMLICDICDYTSSNCNRLKCHKEAVHKKMKKYSCSVCHHKSDDKNHANSHGKNVHNNSELLILSPFAKKCN